jgi:hypothetical protein
MYSFSFHFFFYEFYLRSFQFFSFLVLFLFHIISSIIKMFNFFCFITSFFSLSEYLVQLSELFFQLRLFHLSECLSIFIKYLFILSEY